MVRFLPIFIWFLLYHTTIAPAQQKEQLPPWENGFFDIHHISTGRGSSAFLVFPDGTTLLIDAGDISDTHPRTVSPRNSIRRPDASRTTASWITDYIAQFMPAGKSPFLDYAVITHFHDDHFGEWDETRPRSSKGPYRLTGITGVGDAIRISSLIDRGFTFPIDLNSREFRDREKDDEYHIIQTLDEYRKFIDYYSAAHGLKHQSLRPGAKDQIVLRYEPKKFPGFIVRNIAVNGQVWTGYSDNDFVSTFQPGQYPGENPLSTCLKISYGAFDYFTGGDISGMNALGESETFSMEANVAPVIGPVDVATLNHHGNRDSQSPSYVRTVRPRVWIQSSWSSDHPGEEVLRRITSTLLYPGPRDIFTTDLLESNRQVIGERIDKNYRNMHGHIVVRVLDGGARYLVYVLDDFSSRREIISVHGPYMSR